MLGDWPERDILGAKRLGMKTAFARYGNIFGTKISEADYDIDNFPLVIGLVEDIVKSDLFSIRFDKPGLHEFPISFHGFF